MRLLLLPGVFRPRSDSVLLADTLRRLVDPGTRVLDLCTGSGIAAVAAARLGADVAAVDISRRAVCTARMNAALNGVAVDARRSDLYGAVAGELFDLIVSNPPYLPGSGPAAAARGAARAWEGGGDGRDLIDRIIEGAPAHLRPGGRLALIHSSICNLDGTAARMQAAGMEPSWLVRQRGPLGPLVSARAAVLEAAGILAPGEREEEVAIICGTWSGSPAGVAGMA